MRTIDDVMVIARILDARSAVCIAARAWRW
jgi:hypothetical protein